MHEAIISRQPVQRNEELNAAIMVAENCVLVHPDCDMKMGSMTTTRVRAVKQLLKHEGYDAIMAWLDSLEPLSRGSIVADARRLVTAIHQGG